MRFSPRAAFAFASLALALGGCTCDGTSSFTHDDTSTVYPLPTSFPMFRLDDPKAARALSAADRDRIAAFRRRYGRARSHLRYTPPSGSRGHDSSGVLVFAEPRPNDEFVFTLSPPCSYVSRYTGVVIPGDDACPSPPTFRKTRDPQ